MLYSWRLLGWLCWDLRARGIQVAAIALVIAIGTGTYAGLTSTFPLAVTCDFKARELGPDGSHPKYDLKRCFTIGYKSGFRGPWCLEHGHRDTKRLIRELVMLHKRTEKWTAESKAG